ncbi:hypothetical protein OPV22_013076 [Ensete ventricosum]|uniref:Uncharacterized protein n=1 Tax=Ensete ventricosum TaxID=4639 RepID=A0AAV8QYJ4_ENSVE|nr:hypothetical protein OPV22_013076 [Ensete ventricosum]
MANFPSLFAHLLLLQLSAAVLLRQQPLVLEYHRGRLLEGNYTVNLLFYGRFSPSQRSIVADFFRSLSPVYPSLPPPSPASWWHTTSLYGGGGPVRLYLGPQILDEGYSRGKRLVRSREWRGSSGPATPRPSARASARGRSTGRSTDRRSRHCYNARGLVGRKYLLPAMWDPTTSKCSTLV